MTALERRMAWEASLTDEQRWRVEDGGYLRMPEDFGSEDETTNEEESNGL